MKVTGHLRLKRGVFQMVFSYLDNEDGSSIPEPARLEDYSGQFKLRLPKSLHRLLVQKSSEEGVSMNQYCVYLLSKGI